MERCYGASRASSRTLAAAVTAVTAVTAVLCVSLLLGGGARASADGETPAKHWVYDELAEFKQRIRPIFGRDGRYDGVSEEEKDAVRVRVLNEERLNEPVRIDDWAVLLKAVLKIPPESAQDLLTMYAFSLASGDHVTREDAVGGMVKLLTLRYLKASGTAEDLAPARALKDLGDVSDRHRVLVQMAYTAGLVDSRTTEYFRPKDLLTVAEAVSMLNRAIARFGISYDSTDGAAAAGEDGGASAATAPARGRWIEGELQRHRDRLQAKIVALKAAEAILLEGPFEESSSGPSSDAAGCLGGRLSEPVTVAKWAEVLGHTLNLRDRRVIDAYTAGLVSGLRGRSADDPGDKPEDETVPRGVAVAGLVKLLHFAGMLEADDASEKELVQAAAAFSDFAEAFDPSKLAIAYREGLVRGYPDGLFRPGRPLTRAEALQLMLNVIDRLV